MGRLVLIVWFVTGCSSIFGLDTVTYSPGDAGADALAPGPWIQVANGDAHTCALQQDGSLWCWGSNANGQLGLGATVTDAETPARVGTATWSQVSTHASTTCAIGKTDGSLWCWGYNLNSNIGDGTSVDRPEPVAIAGRWKFVAAGRQHTCAIRDSGVAACWGAGGSGQIGNGQNLPRTTPTDVTSAQTWVAIDVGDSHTCALATGGRAWCWGDGSLGELGQGSYTNANTPQVTGEYKYAGLALGKQHACALRSDRVVICWGVNTSGQLGDPGVSLSVNPAPVIDATNDWTSIGAGSLHTCATKGDGSLWCWGNNTGGQTGDGPTVPYGPVPRQVAGGSVSGWESVVGGDRSTCAIAADHNLWCFGIDSAATSAVARTPTQVAGTWQRVAAGGTSTCGIAEDGSLACWGSNSSGQLGDGTRLPRPEPVTIAPPGWKALDVGDGASCALDNNNALWCWGNNAYGLGDGSFSRLVPTRTTTKTWSAFSVGSMTLAIDAATGLLWCWGANYYGQCGNNDTTYSTVPRQIGTNTWTAVAAGNVHGCGVNSGGLACWGTNLAGEVGDGTTTPRPSPVQLTLPVGVTTGVPAVSNAPTSCALAASGSLWCWGANYFGQVGSQTPGVYTEPSPKAVAGAWKQVSVGGYFVCGIGAAGTLSCWGGNERGQLGDGSLSGHVPPAPVGTASDWTTISAGYQHACGIRSDKTLWCWGSNEYGQLGLGRAAPSGTPRLVLP